MRELNRASQASAITEIMRIMLNEEYMKTWMTGKTPDLSFLSPRVLLALLDPLVVVVTTDPV